MPLTYDDVQRANTIEFIAEEPITITLTRRAQTPDGEGGWTWSTITTVNTTPFRLVPRRSTQQTIDRTTPEGQSSVEEYLLIGYPEANIADGDTFTYGGDTYAVTRVLRPVHWRSRAEVVRRV